MLHCSPVYGMRNLGLSVRSVISVPRAPRRTAESPSDRPTDAAKPAIAREFRSACFGPKAERVDDRDDRVRMGVLPMLVATHFGYGRPECLDVRAEIRRRRGASNNSERRAIPIPPAGTHLPVGATRCRILTS